MQWALNKNASHLQEIYSLNTLLQSVYKNLNGIKTTLNVTEIQPNSKTLNAEAGPNVQPNPSAKVQHHPNFVPYLLVIKQYHFGRVQGFPWRSLGWSGETGKWSSKQLYCHCKWAFARWVAAVTGVLSVQFVIHWLRLPGTSSAHNWQQAAWTCAKASSSPKRL